MLTLDLPREWLEVVQRLVDAHLPDAEVLAFGSRVNGTSHQGSDLDLVTRNPIDPTLYQPGLSGLREALSESNLPILVDILDWARLPESFQQEIIRGGFVVIGKKEA